MYIGKPYTSFKLNPGSNICVFTLTNLIAFLIYENILLFLSFSAGHILDCWFLSAI